MNFRKVVSGVGFAVLGLLLLAVPAVAQNRVNLFGVYDAYDFAYGLNPSVPALMVTAGSPNSGTFTVTVAYGRVATSSGVSFAPLSVNAPVTIGGGSAAEVVTPSAVSCSTPAVYATCQFTATFANAHNNGDLVRTGDAGLQETAAVVVSKGSGGVALSPNWFHALGGHSAGLTALVTYHSLATATYVVLDYFGVTGALSYAAASGSVYATTTHVLY